MSLSVIYIQMKLHFFQPKKDQIFWFRRLQSGVTKWMKSIVLLNNFFFAIQVSFFNDVWNWKYLLEKKSNKLYLPVTVFSLLFSSPTSWEKIYLKSWYFFSEHIWASKRPKTVTFILGFGGNLYCVVDFFYFYCALLVFSSFFFVLLS